MYIVWSWLVGRQRLILLFILVTVLFGSLITFGVGRAVERLTVTPGGPTVLHIQARRDGAGPSTSLEAWLDMANYEGRIAEAALDGSNRQVTVVTNGTHSIYRSDENSGWAVIRRGIRPDSPFSTGIRDQLLVYRVAAERGTGKVVGTSDTGGRTVDRIQLSIEDGSVIADVDRESGVTMREEMSSPGLETAVRDTNYMLIEYIARSEVPPEVFLVDDLPADTSREEYDENYDYQTQAGDRRYAVYVVTSEGSPINSFRYRSTSREGLSSDKVYITYRSDRSDFGEVQVLSGLPPNPTFLNLPPGKGSINPPKETVVIAGRVWFVESSPGRVWGSTTLEDAYVTIYAPNRPVFDRAAASLQKVGPSLILP